MNSSKQHDTWSDDLQLPPRDGFLKHDILERICRFLPTQHDCYQACFIDRSWRCAATNVLWEAPIFKTPISFRMFLKIIADKKQLALNVKHLTLCLPDDVSNTLLKPINRSEVERHKAKDIILSRPNIIFDLIQYCQKITGLTIYGWNLQQRNFDELYTLLPELKNLTVIGNHSHLQQQTGLKTSTDFQLNTYLPRLSGLVLDGLFPISLSFAQAIASKAQHLTTLHLSLSSMDPSILGALCEPDTALNLNDLTFTHGKNLNDRFLQRILHRFSNLRKLRLEGTKYMTSNALKIALENCTHLQHLEIRQVTLNKPPTHVEYQFDDQFLVQSSDLRTLVTENLWLTNDSLELLGNSCPSLSSIALCHIGTDVNDFGMQALLGTPLRYLRHLNLIGCPMVTADILNYLPSSLYTLHLESNGTMEPVDIFNICLHTVNEATDNNLRPNLHRICIVGYENIALSAIGTHAIERMDYQAKQWEDDLSTTAATRYQVTLNDQAIDALAHSDDFIVIPENKLLTGKQIVELARKLQVPLHQFVQLLDELKETSLDHTPPSVTAPKSRVDMLKTTMSEARPSTPLLWAGAVNDSDSFPPQKPHTSSICQESMALGSTPASPLALPSNSDSRSSGIVSSQSQLSSEYEYEQQTLDGKENWLDNERTDSDISLGGWGNNDVSWGKSKSRSKGINLPTTNIHAQNTNHDHTQIIKAAINWDQGKNDDQSLLQSQAMVHPTTSISSRVGRQRTDLKIENDEWGQPMQHLTWAESKPFVSEVLKNQEETTYWMQDDDSNWLILGKGGSSTGFDGNKEQPVATTRFSTTTKISSPKMNGASVMYTNEITHTNNNNNNNNNNSNISININSDFKHSNNERTIRRNSSFNNGTLSSDGSDIDWDDDDGITIKTNNLATISRQLPRHNPNMSGWEGRQGKSNGRESRANRFSRTKSSMRTGHMSSLSRNQPDSTSSQTNPWRQFAKNPMNHDSVPNLTRSSPPHIGTLQQSTTQSSSSEQVDPFSSAVDRSTASLLVDTSDNAMDSNFTTWPPKDNQSTLNEIYDSMAEIEIDNDKIYDHATTNNNLMEVDETVLWQDTLDSSYKERSDNNTIEQQDIGEVDSDVLLLGLSTPEPVDKNNNMNNDSKEQSDNNSTNITLPALIDSNTDDTETTQPIRDSPIISPPVDTLDTTGSGNPDSENDSNMKSDNMTSESPDSNPSSQDQIAGRLAIGTPNGRQILTLYTKRDKRVDVHTFCEQYGMLDQEEEVFSKAYAYCLEHKTNRIFSENAKDDKKKKKKKKKKKESSTEG
ncbi:uncharacterized protein BX664DRAFT_33715 [Halteromyces radiatus]|uniref:uncharacterized protein n=1 Tax=Halteromyces radiatus TaxID=101107 RepID=UPI0022204BB1|nr:uncharacterized protein BX664DRAFT_33715 [Halteromyces radiatus]KAI8100103.1 hypothetical protein BX664DRAFT_33715 [Halteromyces radiatus]